MIQGLVLVLIIGLTVSIKVQQWVTRTDDNQQTLLTRWADLDLLKTVSPEKNIQIKFDTSNPSNFLQQMDGFGCSLTESSGALLLALRKSDYFKYLQTLESLFGETGIQINMLRIPISSSDFSVDDYTFSDYPQNDPTLSKFSIDKLNRYVIPVLRDILLINPKIKLMLSPWTGPAWIKDNPSLHWGTLKNQYIDTWALYLYQSVQAIQNAVNTKIHSLTMQNEPLHDPCDYSCMRMSTEQQGKVAKSLRKLLDAGGQQTKILVFDHNWDDTWYPIEVFSFAGVKDAADGAAFHCYGGEVKQQSFFYDVVQKEVHMTECSGGEWSPEFKSNVNWIAGTLSIQGTLHRAQSVLLWNLALDQNHSPHLGGCSNCRGFITGHRPSSDTGNVPQAVDSVSYNVEYYAIAHFSQFIDDSYFRIDTEIDDQTKNNCLLAATFFSQINHKTAVIVNNQCLTPQQISITDKVYGTLNMDFVAPGVLTLFYDYSISSSNEQITNQ